MAEKKRQKNPYPLGAQPEADGVRFSLVSRDPDCGILLYDVPSGKRVKKIPFSEEDRTGNVYCTTVEGIAPETVCYQFYRGRETVPDERGRRFTGIRSYGKEQKPESWKALLLPEEYDWEGDRSPGIPYCDALFYCLHVRGFTRHASSEVVHRGTFAGIGEKIPYLKEIGVTTLELQPAYEFAENHREENPLPWPGSAPAQAADRLCEPVKLNYWGYKRGFYYAPKASYAAGGDAAGEFRQLVKELHQNGLELVMQFYFPPEVNRSEIPEILRFWVLEYHVDGFHLMGERLPMEAIVSDELLADRKLLYYGFEDAALREGRDYPHLGEYNDSYLYDMRRFLKGDENMLGSVLRQMRYIPGKGGRVHYITNYWGFTLADLVSYDYRHNEANGEDNRDGSDYNCSWNCGEEGTARSRRVRQLRLGQMKNAMCLLLLTQSTPLIFMGDEFGNSQKGNNNPWCQDNAISWLDWSAKKKNGELLEFWKKLTAFRKEHPILHPREELRLMDSLSCGYPDLSYHGENAWGARMDGHIRYAGIMLCGKYAQTRGREDAFLYIALNMHWMSHELALPRLPKGMRWETAIAAGTEEKGPEEERENTRQIPPRSVIVYIGVGEAEKPEREKPGKKSGKAAADRR